MIRIASFAGLLAIFCTGAAARSAGDETAAARPLAAAAVPAPAAAADSASDRRVLVMLHLPPEHYRPTSDYGAGGGYGDAAAAQARKRLAARLARENGLQLAGNWPMPILGIDCVVMVVPDGRSVESVAEHMSHLASVDWSQPMHEFETQGASPAHNDRLFQAQPAAQEWKLADLHRMATGKGVKVAVVDSEVDESHPDLRGRVVDSRDFVGGEP